MKRKDPLAKVVPGLLVLTDVSLAILALVLANTVFGDRVLAPDSMELAAATTGARITEEHSILVAVRRDGSVELSGRRFEAPARLIDQLEVEGHGPTSTTILLAVDQRASWGAGEGAFDELRTAGFTVRFAREEESR